MCSLTVCGFLATWIGSTIFVAFLVLGLMSYVLTHVPNVVELFIVITWIRAAANVVTAGGLRLAGWFVPVPGPPHDGVAVLVLVSAKCVAIVCVDVCAVVRACGAVRGALQKRAESVVLTERLECVRSALRGTTPRDLTAVIAGYDGCDPAGPFTLRALRRRKCPAPSHSQTGAAASPQKCSSASA